MFLIFTTQLYQCVFFLFALFSDEPEVFLPKCSQTAILHAAHFREGNKTLDPPLPNPLRTASVYEDTLCPCLPFTLSPPTFYLPPHPPLAAARRTSRAPDVEAPPSVDKTCNAMSPPVTPSPHSSNPLLLLTPIAVT